jgi:hypothetical protein
MFDVLFYLLLVSSCVIVEDMPFEVGQEPSFEEVEPQFLEEEGKWISSPAYCFCPNNMHIITL